MFSLLVTPCLSINHVRHKSRRAPLLAVPLPFMTTLCIRLANRKATSHLQLCDAIRSFGDYGHTRPGEMPLQTPLAHLPLSLLGMAAWVTAGLRGGRRQEPTAGISWLMMAPHPASHPQIPPRKGKAVARATDVGGGRGEGVASSSIIHRSLLP